MNPKTIAEYSAKGAGAAVTLTAVGRGLPALIVVAIVIVTLRLIDVLAPHLPTLFFQRQAERDVERAKDVAQMKPSARRELDRLAERRRADLTALSAAEAASERRQVGDGKSKRR